MAEASHKWHKSGAPRANKVGPAQVNAVFYQGGSSYFDVVGSSVVIELKRYTGADADTEVFKIRLAAKEAKQLIASMQALFDSKGPEGMALWHALGERDYSRD